MSENKAGSWASKYGFKTAKEYVDYMAKYGLWGGDEYIKKRGTRNKLLVILTKTKIL